MRRALLWSDLPVAVGVLATATADARAQVRGWEDREYGIGVVKYMAMYRYAARDVILATPSFAADTVATLARDSLCFRRPPVCVRSYDRMIEFDYEVPGWAILRFSTDSAWVKVTLAPSQPSGPVGWVRLRPDTAIPLLWSQVLPRHRLFFLRRGEIAFYQVPDPKARINRQLVRYSNSDRFDYIMNPLTVRGTWLRVALFSPSAMCEASDLKVTPDTLWIQYLTAAQRPRVFYYTRGC